MAETAAVTLSPETVLAQMKQNGVTDIPYVIANYTAFQQIRTAVGRPGNCRRLARDGGLLRHLRPRLTRNGTLSRPRRRSQASNGDE